jgi:proteasome alpha subunit
MTDEPYRWLEAMGNRREYIASQLRGASPVFAASLPDGILLLGLGTGQSKVFEIFDRHALAGLGHPADLERLRLALIDAAHVEAFTRAPEDVALRRLVGFGLGPQLKTAFEQVFSPPFVARLLLAELGATTEDDVLVRVHFDGLHQIQRGGVAVLSGDETRSEAARAWLAERVVGDARAETVAERMLEVAWCLSRDLPPGDDGARDGWRTLLADRQVEAGWLRRGAPRAAFEPWTFPRPVSA